MFLGQISSVWAETRHAAAFGRANDGKRVSSGFTLGFVVVVSL